MPKYRCLRPCIWGPGKDQQRAWVIGQLYEGDEPKCGAGVSLVNPVGKKKPVFELVPDDAVEELPVEKEDPADNDPRTDDEIRAALLHNFDYKIHPRAKRSTLLAKEAELKVLKGMDSGWE